MTGEWNENSPKMPRSLSSHCVVKINQTHVFISGGEKYRKLNHLFTSSLIWPTYQMRATIYYKVIFHQIMSNNCWIYMSPVPLVFHTKCPDPCPAPFPYFVRQKGYVHLFPLIMGTFVPPHFLGRKEISASLA